VLHHQQYVYIKEPRKYFFSVRFSVHGTSFRFGPRYLRRVSQSGGSVQKNRTEPRKTSVHSFRYASLIPTPYSTYYIILFTSKSAQRTPHHRLTFFFPPLIFVRNMKLSDHIIAIDLAFEALISSIEDLEHVPNLIRDNHGTCIRCDLPRTCHHDTVPRLPTTYQPLAFHAAIYNKEKLLQLAAFKATYHKAKTSLSPDMVPLILDTGASIIVTPYKPDFVSIIKLVQSVELKGIASGLQVQGMGDASYSFYNDTNELQTLLLWNCLYIPHCTARLLCPRQIGIKTGHPMDGFNAISSRSILTVQGKSTTIHFDQISQLLVPILCAAPRN
jgi:hypothetical protein